MAALFDSPSLNIFLTKANARQQSKGKKKPKIETAPQHPFLASSINNTTKASHDQTLKVPPQQVAYSPPTS